MAMIAEQVVLNEANWILELEEDGSLFLVKFHYRTMALHLILLHYFKTGTNLRAEFAAMAQCIPIQWRGRMSRVEAVSIGHGLSASMQQSIKPSWLDIVEAPVVELASGKGARGQLSRSLRHR